MRSLLILALVAACSPEAALSLEVAPQGKFASAPTEQLQGDVVLIMLDDIARSDLELISTPNLDALAAQGTKFTRAYAMPACANTRLTLHRGRWDPFFFSGTCRFPPDSTNPIAAPVLDPDEYITMPDIMKAGGYSTGLFGKWHTGISPNGWLVTPLENGYDTWRAGGPAHLGMGLGPRCNSNGYENWQRIDDGIESVETLYATIAQTDAAINWNPAQRGPRFVYQNYFSPHTPLHNPPAYALPPGYPPAQTPREQFEAMVVSIDIEIGRLVESLPKESWIFVAADNGTFSGNAQPGVDPFKGKATTFENGINVPLIVRGPGVAKGEVCEELVSIVDIYATLAEIAEQPVPGSADDSISMMPLLLDPDSGPIRDLVYVGFRRGDDSDWDEAVLNKTHKFRRQDGPGGYEELYDLVNNPEETHPIEDESIAGPMRLYMDTVLN